jgi:hypothetical protein
MYAYGKFFFPSCITLGFSALTFELTTNGKICRRRTLATNGARSRSMSLA